MGTAAAVVAAGVSLAAATSCLAALVPTALVAPPCHRTHALAIICRHRLHDFRILLRLEPVGFSTLGLDFIVSLTLIRYVLLQMLPCRAGCNLIAAALLLVPWLPHLLRCSSCWLL